MSKKHFFFSFFCAIALGLCPLLTSAQQKLPSGWNTIADRPVALVNKPDTDQWQREDNQGYGTRFAAPLLVDFRPAKDGHWTTTASGHQRWQLRLKAQDALGLSVFFDQLNLPAGSRLYLYAPLRPQEAQSFDAQSLLTRNDRIWMGFIDGDEVVIEYEAPANTTTTPFRIWRLDYAYRSDLYQAQAGTEKMMFGFGTASTCHDNINCAAGANWQIEKKGACRIIVVVEEGSGYCTGTLLNNTAADGKPYLLTGFHCQDGYTPLFDLWRFDFFYEAPACANPAEEPAFTPVFGSTFRAGRQANDFLLVELFSQANNLPLPRYGWDRTGTPPSSAGVVHHPRGDIKKIALSTTASIVQNTTINWNNSVTTPAQHHFRVWYSNGAIEVGASGAALFDQNHRVVGELHGAGATTTCDNTLGYFGRFSLAWEGGGTPSTRLRDWLDPLGTAPMTLDSLASPAGGALSGLVITEDTMPVAQVTLTAINAARDTFTLVTNTSGAYSFPVAASNDTLTLNMMRNDQAGNGVSTLDLIIIRRHVLNITPLDSPYKILAADVNNSGSLSTLDIIQIQRVILNQETSFPAVPSWRFVRANHVFTDPTNPWLNPPVFIDHRFTFQAGIPPQTNFIAIKSGDVNESASVN